MLGIRRREFFMLLGGATVAWPIAARGQQPSKLPTVGLLGADATIWAPWTAAFAARLRELGDSLTPGRALLCVLVAADAAPLARESLAPYGEVADADASGAP